MEQGLHGHEIDPSLLEREALKELAFCRKHTPRLYHLHCSCTVPRGVLRELESAGWSQTSLQESLALLVVVKKNGVAVAERLLNKYPNLAGAFVWRSETPLVSHNILAAAKGTPVRYARYALELILSNHCMKTIMVREKATSREALAHLSRLLSTRDEFFSIATHDLRNPLTTLKLSLELLNLPGTEENRQTLDIMKRNLEKMEVLINDMLEVFRLYRGSFSLNLSDVQINRIVEDNVVSHYPIAVEKDITLDFLLDPRCEPLKADPFRVNQVVANLLSNALKYTSANGTVEVGTLWEGNGVQIHVSDTGPGVSEEEREHIFESFSRGSARATGDEASTGLGLYICKRIMQLHGGRIWVESSGNKGSTFYAFFPNEVTPEENGQ